MNTFFKKRGFTLIELIIVIAIMGIVTTIAVVNLGDTTQTKKIEKGLNITSSAIERARMLSINSSNFSEFGVKFSSTSIDIFQGLSFSSTTVVETYDLDGGIFISNINLNGGVDEFYFSKIKGIPSATGTVSVGLNGTSTIKNIIIYGTGLSEIE